MTNTSLEQDQLLAKLAAADAIWRASRRIAVAEAQTTADREVQGLLAARDILVRQAFESGIPKRQIGAKGLGTLAPGTVTESLERTAFNPTVARTTRALAADTTSTPKAAA